MRLAFASILCVFILGGVEARAVEEHTKDVHDKAGKLDFTHISDYPLDDPRNPINGRALPEHSNELHEAARALDFTEISDYPLDDPRNPINGRSMDHDTIPKDQFGDLENRNADPAGPATRPKPNRPKRVGLEYEYEDPKGLGFTIDRSELLDESDVVELGPCGSAKRSLKDVGTATLVGRMSGEENAKDAEEWIRILNEVESHYADLMGENTDLGASLRDYHQEGQNRRFVNVIFLGGINTVFLGGREKTGDIDFAFDPSTPSFVKKAFKTATNRMVVSRPGQWDTRVDRRTGQRVVIDPINNAWERWTKKQRPQAWHTLAEFSTERAWSGRFIDAKRGDERMSLMDKINRIGDMRTKYGNYKPRDATDAKFLMEQIRRKYNLGNRQFSVDDFRAWGVMDGLDNMEGMSGEKGIDAIVARSMRAILGDSFEGVDQSVKDLVAARNC